MNQREIQHQDLAAEIEAQRKKGKPFTILGLMFLVGGVLLLIVAIFTYGTIALGEEGTAMALTVTALLIVGAILLFVGDIFKKRIDRLIGETIVQKALSSFITNISYNKKDFIPKSTLKQSQLLKGFHRVTGSDLTQGQYKGVPVTLSDIEIYKTVSENESSNSTGRKVVFFKGQWILMELKKEVPGEIRIWSKAIAPKIKKAFATEDTAFNEKYQVEIKGDEALSLTLSSNLRQRIEALSDLVGAGIMVALIGNEAHLAVYNGKDYFEVSGKKKDLQNLEAIETRMGAEATTLQQILEIFTQENHLTHGNDRYNE